jgi:hypothetical protein
MNNTCGIGISPSMWMSSRRRDAAVFGAAVARAESPAAVACFVVCFVVGFGAAPAVARARVEDFAAAARRALGAAVALVVGFAGDADAVVVVAEPFVACAPVVVGAAYAAAPSQAVTHVVASHT